MSHESEIATILQADATLTGILTGGIYAMEDLDRRGISPEATVNAFDSLGRTKPCALVRGPGDNLDAAFNIPSDGIASAFEIVQVYLYEDSGYANIDAALARIFTLLQGEELSDTFELEWANTINRQREEGGPLDGSSLARQDWGVYFVKGA